MPITSYLDQLRTEASTFDADAERCVRLAFADAGIPSSTYYRARMGAELKFVTAKQVAGVLHRWKSKGSPPNVSRTGKAAATVKAA